MYAGRKGLETLVIEGEVGGMATKSSSVENYPGFPDIPGDDLMQKFARHARDVGTVIAEDVGMAIAVKDGRFRITTLSEKEYTAKAVIAATGRSPRLFGAQGEAPSIWARVLPSVRPVTARCTKGRRLQFSAAVIRRWTWQLRWQGLQHRYM